MKLISVLLLTLALQAPAQNRDRVFLKSSGSWTNASAAIKAAERLCNSPTIPDKAAGRQLMLELARAGRVEAALNLWSEDMPVELARELLTPYAQKGNIRAILNLASTLRRIGYPKEAVFWCGRAANGGDRIGKLLLARAYVDGYGGRRDWNAAATLFEEVESFTERAGLVSDNSVEAYKWIRVAQLRGQDVGASAKGLDAYPKTVVDSGERQALAYVARRYPASRR